MPSSENLRKKIGEHLAEFREEMGLTQSELGEAAGYDKFWISRRELGQVSISLDDLPAIMQALKIKDPLELIEGRRRSMPERLKRFEDF